MAVFTSAESFQIPFPKKNSYSQPVSQILDIQRYPALKYPQTSFSKSPRTPIAVTAAPAPAPWMISGLAPYRSVWNMMILSAPPSDVAKGCVFGYLHNNSGQGPSLEIDTDSLLQ